MRLLASQKNTCYVAEGYTSLRLGLGSRVAEIICDSRRQQNNVFAGIHSEGARVEAQLLLGAKSV